MVIIKVTRIYTGRQKKSTAPELAPTAFTTYQVDLHARLGRCKRG